MAYLTCQAGTAEFGLHMLTRPVRFPQALEQFEQAIPSFHPNGLLLWVRT